MPCSVDSVGQFLKLFLAHESDLRAYVGAVVRDPSARDDVFQEVALALWRSFERFDPQRSFGAWARGVATNKVLDYQRRTNRRAMTFSAAAIEAVQRAFDETESPPSERQAALAECLNSLPVKSTELLELRYTHGASIPDLATRLGASPAAIYQSLSRIRALLAKCIQRRLNADHQSLRTGLSALD